MPELPNSDLSSLQEERRVILQMYKTGELDTYQTTLRLLRVDIDLRHTRRAEAPSAEPLLR